MNVFLIILLNIFAIIVTGFLASLVMSIKTNTFFKGGIGALIGLVVELLRILIARAIVGDTIEPSSSFLLWIVNFRIVGIPILVGIGFITGSSIPAIEDEKKDHTGKYKLIIPNKTDQRFVTRSENIEERRNQILDERLKTRSQKLIDPILAEKDKGIITNEEFLQKEKEIIEKNRLDLIQQDSCISYDVYLKLASTKQATVERFLETIDKNESIVLHHNKIKLVTKEMWNSIVSEGIAGNYEIIYKCAL